MPNVLVINGHPDFAHSTANAAILEHFKTLVPDAVVRSVEKTVKEGTDYVAAEQEALRWADVVVWQFPVYWYSVPAKMKQWIDDVLAYGFAYGTGGTALHGKKLVVSVTTGGSEDEYTPAGAEHYTLKDFLVQFHQTAMFCGMEYLEPVASYGMMVIPGVTSEEAKAEVWEKARRHAEMLATRVA